MGAVRVLYGRRVGVGSQPKYCAKIRKLSTCADPPQISENISRNSGLWQALAPAAAPLASAAVAAVAHAVLRAAPRRPQRTADGNGLWRSDQGGARGLHVLHACLCAWEDAWHAFLLRKAPIPEAHDSVQPALTLQTMSVDRNGPCKSLKLGNFVDREIGAIWWWRGWIPPFRRSRGRRWRKRIGAEMMGLVVALSQSSCAPRLRGASGCRAGSRRVPRISQGCPRVVCGVRVVYKRGTYGVL